MKAHLNIVGKFMGQALEKLKELTNNISDQSIKRKSSFDYKRKDNYAKLEKIFYEIGVSKKIDNFLDIFDLKAINLSGASLMEENLGEVFDGKYLQILAIGYDKNASNKTKNISLVYFGRAEKVDEVVKNRAVEFVLRYRLEKTFITLEHYSNMVEKK